jgi:plasmid stabilization system protein ParE
VFLPAAEADYRQALAWYQARSPRAAAGFEAAVEDALRRIAGVPEQWPLCDDRHRFYVLRRYPYSIIYRIESGDILVIAVAHSSRSATYWQRRG